MTRRTLLSTLGSKRGANLVDIICVLSESFVDLFEIINVDSFISSRHSFNSVAHCCFLRVPFFEEEDDVTC